MLLLQHTNCRNTIGGAGTDVNAELCNGTTGSARDDVWFSFLAQTTDINITFESSNFDGVLTLHSGDCNALVLLACSDDNITNPTPDEEISYSGLVVGQTYYTRVYFFGSTTPSNPVFNIKIWSTIATVDIDNDGYGSVVDCNDTNAAIFPGAVEICDGIDNDCDGLIDDNDPDIVGQNLWYADTDNDGFGNASSSILSCSVLIGYGSKNLDCDDTNASINPGVTDIADNNIDEDCDGFDAKTWYQDLDGDGFGNPSVTIEANFLPFGYSAFNTDCDDTNAAIHPGSYRGV